MSEQNQQPSDADLTGGQGGVLLEDPHHIREDLRMAERAIRKGWVKEKRWDTDATAETIEKKAKEGPLSLKDRMLLAVMNGVVSDDPRVSGIAVKNGLQMESQNQADEHKALPDLTFNIHKMAEDEKKSRLNEIISQAQERRRLQEQERDQGHEVAGKESDQDVLPPE